MTFLYKKTFLTGVIGLIFINLGLQPVMADEMSLTNQDITQTQLKESTSSEELVAGKNYSVKKSINIYLDEEKQQEIGHLEAGAMIKLIKSTNKADLVELELWSQNKSRVLLLDMGFNVIDATLTKEFKEKAQYTVVEKKRRGRTSWEKIKFQAWIEKSQLSVDLNSLWENAEKIFKNSCSACHKAPEPSHHTANQWVALFNGMVGRTNIDPDTTGKQVLRYLQMHASDFKKDQ